MKSNLKHLPFVRTSYSGQSIYKSYLCTIFFFELAIQTGQLIDSLHQFDGVVGWFYFCLPVFKKVVQRFLSSLFFKANHKVKV